MTCGVPAAVARRVTVVGGGITGLLTAVGLADAGAQVTVLEQKDTVGGQIRSIEVDGAVVDVGAESLHTATPGILELLQRLELETAITEAHPGPTLVVRGRHLRRLPTGFGPTGPSRLWPVVTARILNPAGLLRAACEPLVPWSHHGKDLAVGTYLTARFGAQLTDRLVDPLLGNLHAGDVHRLGLAAAVPPLDRAARSHRSLVLGRRGSHAGPARRFVTLCGGLAQITDTLAADPRIDVRCSSPVSALQRTVDGDYLVVGDNGALTQADAVVLAVPSAVAARLIAAQDARAGRALDSIESASVATVVANYRRADVANHPAFRANGLLVPSTAAGRLLKAATFLSGKWPHLALQDSFLVRMSAGRAGQYGIDQLDDGELAERLHGDLAELTGLSTAPHLTVVRRWPATMPQLHVGHLDIIASVRERLNGRHRIVLAGAAYDGVGIGNCLRSARAAVAHLAADHDTEERAA
ncbi:MAG: protoporphyrinogen oxidase [Nitriliruptoraceae bacterium]